MWFHVNELLLFASAAFRRERMKYTADSQVQMSASSSVIDEDISRDRQSKDNDDLNIKRQEDVNREQERQQRSEQRRRAR